MSAWANKYVGVEFAQRGRDLKTGVDCWGLVYNVLRDEFNIQVPSGDNLYEHTEDLENISKEIKADLPGWQQVAKGNGSHALDGDLPQEGDLVLFSIHGEPVHIGIVINAHEMLHCSKGAGTVVESFLGSMWCKRVIGVYRHLENPDKPVELPPKRIITIPEGQAIRDAFSSIDDELLDKLEVLIDGEVVENWREAKPRVGAVVEIRTFPEGDVLEKLVKVFTILAIVVAAPYIATSLGFTAGTLAFAAATSLISVAGVLLVNQLFGGSLVGGVGRRGPTDPSESPNYFIQDARNRAQLFGTIPQVLGRCRMVPPLAAANYTEISGADQFLYVLLCWGNGPLELSEFKIGDTDITGFQDVTYEHQLNNTGSVPSIYPKDMYQDNLNGGVPIRQGRTDTRASARNASKLTVDLVFEGGLVDYNDEGNRENRSVDLEILYRPIGTGSFTSVTRTTVTAATALPHRWSHTWTPSPAGGHFDVRVVRHTSDSTSSRVRDTFTWTALRTHQGDIAPVVRSEVSGVDRFKNIALTAVKIRANEQLNRNIDQFNAVVQSHAPVYNATTKKWSDMPTSNPASLFLLVLEAEEANNKLTTGSIDRAKFADWWTYCDANGLSFNMVRDFKSSVWDVLKEIAATGNAVPTIDDGKIGVIIDQPRTVVKQLFTSRNSRDFTTEVAYPDVPDAVRVKYLNELSGFLVDEQIVKRARTQSEGAYPSQPKIVNMEFPGVTNPTLVGRFALGAMLRAQVQNKRHSLTVDAEHLVCKRGDRVQVSNNLFTGDTRHARIKSINGTVLEMDAPVQHGADTDTFQAVIRTDGNAIIEQTVTFDWVNSVEEQITLSSADTRIKVGDLVAVGKTDNVVQDFLIESVEFESDLVAKLHLLDYHPSFYDGTYVAPNQTGTGTIATVAPGNPSIVGTAVGDGTTFDSQGRVLVNVLVTVNPAATPNVVTEVFEYRHKDATSTDWIYGNASASATASFFTLQRLLEGVAYDIEVRAKGESGLTSGWVATTFTGDDTSVSTSSPLPSIGNIFLEGATATEPRVFNTRDALVRWDRDAEVDPRFESYSVTYKDENGTALSTESVLTNQVYVSYMNNLTLNNGAPARIIEVAVQAKGVNNSSGPEASIRIENPQIGQIDVTYTQVATQLYFQATYSSGWPQDFQGIEVHVSNTANFKPTTATLLQRSQDRTGLIEGVDGQILHYRFGAYDSFGTDNITYTDSIEISYDAAGTIPGSAISSASIAGDRLQDNAVTLGKLSTTLQRALAGADSGTLADGVLTGTIIMWPGTGVPSDRRWVVCDGRRLLRANFAALYGVIGETYTLPGDPTESNRDWFRVPDLRGRIVFGREKTRGNLEGETDTRKTGLLTFSGSDQLGTMYGAESVTLSASESGQKAISAGSSTSITHMKIKDPTETSGYILRKSTDTTLETIDYSYDLAEMTTSSVPGSSAVAASAASDAHNNLPPLMTMNYFIKV